MDPFAVKPRLRLLWRQERMIEARMGDDAGQTNRHLPVLAGAALEYLAVRPGGTIVDATVGMGGHSAGIAAALGPSGRLIAIDRDPVAIEEAKTRVRGCEVDWVQANFAELPGILRSLGIDRVDGVLADIGVSSVQLDDATRGFSFQHDGPLDMRMDPSVGEPASRLVARLSAHDLAAIFWEYGEEKASRQIAARIVEERVRAPINTTAHLAYIVRGVLGRKGKRRRDGSRGVDIDPATRVFQALRIAVNNELGSLDALLSDLPWRLRPGGRAVVISFHSLEDRRVKHAFRDQEVWEVLTKKPVRPDEAEMQANPRSRSAKLRAAARR